MPLSNYKGRYSGPVPTSNLHIDDKDDFKDFEPFDSSPDAGPRGFPDGGEPLQVMEVNMRKDVNTRNHYTTEYTTNLLVVRRGQSFVIDVTLSRPLMQQDDFQLEFLIGADPSPNRGSHVVVTFGNRRGGRWSGEILGVQGNIMSLSVKPHAKAIVGMYRTYVAISAANGMIRTRKDPNTNMYLLFNPWCPEDDVFYPDDAGRFEYVMNPVGIIYQGSADFVGQRSWIYGQFEEHILDACIYILDASQMPIQSRGNVIKIVRKASAMINSLDDQGVLVGNWSDDYSMGRNPSAWIGSIAILQKYYATGVPVRYAQCWVFAGVLCTFLRCLGIPGRVISNFNSAHDNTGNLICELIFNEAGLPDRRNTRDSIWNYHAWCEAFMNRFDLPPKYKGWQVVDATPQETSDGHYRCGPAPVIAIKDGELCHPFDCGFVFAEVNSDIIYIKRDRYGTMTPFKVDTTYIGKLILTKAIGSMTAQNVTFTYKYPEGSAEDERTMTLAEQYGCERDHPELPEAKFSVEITAEPCSLGDTVKVLVTFNNQSELNKTVQAHLQVSVVFYTGVVSNSFKEENFTLHVAAHQSNSAVFEVPPQEYMPLLRSKNSLHFLVNGKSGDEEVSDFKVVLLTAPRITITVKGTPQVQKKMFVTVRFKNPLNMTLHNATLTMEAAGLMNVRVFPYSVISPNAEISQTVEVTPKKPGLKYIVAQLDCDNLNDVQETLEVNVSP
ncbi:coagulation factor XIII A chain-like [Leuresthes tenuis]|uniref:coagulation factor XIII A chain-like n=1 Tax=Leuresthes tenuis TaxID=355514 RepID=UPI003B50DC91